MLVREEASTGRARCRRAFTVSLSVLKCDHKGCDEAICVGPGDGHTLTDEQFEDARDQGWVQDDRSRDYCPEHKSDAEPSDDGE